MKDKKVSKANLQEFAERFHEKNKTLYFNKTDGGTEIANATADWLAEHVVIPDEAVVVDNSLTVEGAAADAKVVGGRLTDFNEQLDLLRDKSKNLINPNKTTNGVIYADNGGITPSQYYETTDFIPVSANEYITVSPRERAVLFFDTNKNPITSSFDNTETQATRVIQAPANGFLRLTMYKADEGEWQAEKGQTQTAYEPYDTLYLRDNVTIPHEDEYVKIEPNLFDDSLSEVGYLESNGSVNSVATSYKTSSFIPVRAGFVYHISTLRKFLAYDSTKNIVSGSYVDDSTTNYQYTANADGYLRFSYLSSAEISFYRTYSVEPIKRIEEGIGLSKTMISEVSDKSGNVLSGKKWWACGDSFTAWTTEEYVATDAPNVDGLSHYKTYPYWIGKRNPNLAVYNYAVSGQTMATPETGDFTNAFSNDLYKNIPLDVDYITLYFGINDSHHRQGSSGGDGEDNTGVIPLGTIDDSTTATFYGAWNVVLEYLITNYPWAKIGIIITNGAETEDYPQAEILLAKKWGIPYLDLNGDYKLPLMLRSNGKTDVCETAVNIRKNQQWTSVEQGNGHPNVNAHEFESTFIEAWLRSI